MTTLAPPVPTDLATDLAALRADGYRPRPVKSEIRANLIARLAAGEPAFPGIIGFEGTVGPQLERALLAGHDVVLLGERGQGKTRLIRTLTNLLDEWIPVVEGCEINDDPTAPICARCRRLAADLGDALPVTWRHRSERFGEKLATPDTSVGDLVGDIDPVKVAEGRSLGDAETIHYGLVPRTHRGIFAINELPDLAERIQVALLNVLEERDIQVRGYQVRLPLDLLVVASANPEDYTNRGRIITPLKDRFGAEVRTHYPTELAAEIDLVRQEARVEALVPDHLLDVVARFTHAVRACPSIDARSGVSARFAIACVESLSGAAIRRAAITGEPEPVARIGDLADVVPTLRGKVEFDVSAEGDEDRTLDLLARRATAEAWRAHLGGEGARPVLAALVAWFDDGGSLVTGDTVPATTVLAEVGPVTGLGRLVTTLEPEQDATPGVLAACLEFAVEGLWLTRRIDKDAVGAVHRYASAGPRE